jgi:hypothetical protein
MAFKGVSKAFQRAKMSVLTPGPDKTRVQARAGARRQDIFEPNQA